MTSGGTTYMPLRVNMAGVIPVIFASSVVILPPTLAELGGRGSFFESVSDFLAPGSWYYIIFEALLIILFTYFYTAVQFANPVEQADNLKKYGGFIPGVRPGVPTAVYLDRALTRLTLPGAIYPAAVAELPNIVFRYLPVERLLRVLGGTSILIVVGVALDTMRQMEAQLMMRQYGFLK